MPFYNFYNALIAIGNFLQSFFLLGIRLYWGYSFFQSGLAKFQNIPHVAGFFETLAIPFPTFNAYLVGGVECIGGICLILGLASRLAAIPLIVAMIVAYLTAHLDSVKTILENPESFIKQGPFTYLFVCLIIFVFGPGKISIDFLLERFIFKQKRLT